METLQVVIQYILDLGAAVFVPFLMLIVGLAMKMKFREASTAALTLGIAYCIYRYGNSCKLYYDKYGCSSK